MRVSWKSERVSQWVELLSRWVEWGTFFSSAAVSGAIAGSCPKQPPAGQDDMKLNTTKTESGLFCDSLLATMYIMYIYMYVYTLYSQRDSDKHLNSSENFLPELNLKGISSLQSTGLSSKHKDYNYKRFCRNFHTTPKEKDSKNLSGAA